MDPEILKLLTGLQTDQTAFIAKIEAERKEFGEAKTETVLTLKNIQERIDAIEQKMVKAPKPETKSLMDTLKENEDIQRLMRDKKGRSAQFTLTGDHVREFIEGKAITTTTMGGYSTPDLMPSERGRYVQEARVDLPMRSVIPARPITVGQVVWPRADNVGSKASPVAEAALKPTNTFVPTMETERVKKIATTYDFSQEVLADWSELEGLIRNIGRYKVQHEEDRQILFGDGTGENLNGLTTQAQAFSYATNLTPAGGYQYMDVIAAAAAQVDADNEMSATFVVVNKANHWKMRLTKDSNGNYIMGGPGSGAPSGVWGLRVVPTNMMPSGSFLVGSSSPLASEIRDRLELSVMMSTEHANNFTYNLVTILFESRLLLAVYRPDAFVYGSLNQSPA